MREIEELRDLQDKQIIELIRSQAWGDISGQLVGMEEMLRLAMDATVEYLGIWEHDDAGERRYGDECSVSEHDLEAMSNEWRLAYVARLLRSLAMDYGVTTDWRSVVHGLPPTPNVGQNDANSPAAVLRGINDIICLPTAHERHSA
jgi:hypothetical protein